MTITYDFDDPVYYDVADMRSELDRVFELCHGCRLCWDLCPSFDTMFKQIDARTDGIDVDLPHAVQDRIVDECYQCKLCFIKCPYTPPHEWELDFPKLMLRALGARTGGRARSAGDKLLSATTTSGRLGSAAAPLANATLEPNGLVRSAFERVFGIASERLLPTYNRVKFSKWWEQTGRRIRVEDVASNKAEPVNESGGGTPSFLEPTEDELAAQRPGTESFSQSAEAESKAAPRVAEAPGRDLTFFPSCMIEYQDAAPGKATVRVLKHNGCNVDCALENRCCGMPSLDAGDIKAFIDKAQRNVVEVLPHVRAGRLIAIAQPTCNYVFRKEYPHYLGMSEAREVADAVVDPAEYLVRRSRTDGINEDFTTELGTVAYHAACHLRAQQQGYNARELLQRVPGTRVQVVEGCSGIDGTWGYRARNVELAKEIIKPTAQKLRDTKADLCIGDCLLADVAFEEEGLARPIHPMQALARAYGLEES